VLADEADGALTEGNMNITFTTGDSTATTIKRLTNKYALDFSDNKYVINFWTDEGTLTKSGTASDTYQLGIAEKYIST
jgi:6-phosphogluconolactonase/glucosamine-6-phosphate isomerase/deaminase